MKSKPEFNAGQRRSQSRKSTATVNAGSQCTTSAPAINARSQRRNSTSKVNAGSQRQKSTSEANAKEINADPIAPEPIASHVRPPRSPNRDSENGPFLEGSGCQLILPWSSVGCSRTVKFTTHLIPYRIRSDPFRVRADWGTKRRWRSSRSATNAQCEQNKH